MWASWWKGAREEGAATAADRIRQRYAECRELISLNNECLELLAGLQEDLFYVPPRRDVVGTRVDAIFGRAEGIVSRLERLAARPYPTLRSALRTQRHEVEGSISARLELDRPRLSAGLSEVGRDDALEVGGKAAALGEVRRLGIPVPDGFVLTTEAYRSYCGIPCWTRIRDAFRAADFTDLDASQSISAGLAEMVLSAPLPRAVEVALTERGLALPPACGFAVRSSAFGEGGAHSFAGQFDSRINVPRDQLVDAYKWVVASRFSPRALLYRQSAGLSEVDSPMAVLVLPTLRARASGILYTRDPANPRSRTLWVTATWGLGLDLANGATRGDLFILSRTRPHDVVERQVSRKAEQIVLHPGGGVRRRPVEAERAEAPSLDPPALATLARWALEIEAHFKAPQDIEWVLDEDGRLWILQTRPLALADAAGSRIPSRARGTPLTSGGRTVYPGRVSGSAFVVDRPSKLNATPAGAIVFVRRAAPDIVKVLPHAAGVVADWGNVTGHAAALLREFKIPSVFEMTGAFDLVRTGDAVSLDSVQAALYRERLWPARTGAAGRTEHTRARDGDPIRRRLLTLNLLDPSAFNFRPAGCRSTHDVIRFCHEKAIEAMFALNDRELNRGAYRAHRLMTPAPVNLHVLDLSGGLALADPDAPDVTPPMIRSRPFQALWKGVTHPGVTWRREMPASLSGLAAVMAGGLSSTASGAQRALGEKSYLLITSDYMNLNSRLAYHFTLVDACVSDTSVNYIFFRFAGGAATQWRRNLRACFVEICLTRYGFHVDRRGDLVNAWFKNAAADDTAARLDIIGRLMACTSQLDMYMTSDEVMNWYVQQFMTGNYAFIGTDADGMEAGTGSVDI